MKQLIYCHSYLYKRQLILSYYLFQMEKLAVCRICLVKNVRMYDVIDDKLQEFYEKLTLVPFETSDSRPGVVCYMCHKRLQKCYQFSVKCLETEDMFTQMLSDDNEKLSYIDHGNSEPFRPLSAIRLVHINIESNPDEIEDLVVKAELQAARQNDDTTMTDDDEQSDPTNGDANNKADYKIQSESEDNVLSNVNNGVETEPKTKRVKLTSDEAVRWSYKMDGDYYIDDLHLLDEIYEFENQLPLLRRVKFYKTRRNPLEELQEDEFKSEYSFSRSTAVFIIDMLKNDLSGDSRGGCIPPYLKVLTAIRTWARGEIQDDAGDQTGMSQPTISLVCKQVALALVAQNTQWIKMPRTDIEQNNVIADFYSICGFSHVVGAIDCTHVRIPKVSGDNGHYYVNRKGYNSLNVQVVSNTNLEIMDIVARWPGSTHDSVVFSESYLKRRFDQGEFRGRLLGHSGYPCTPYLFTPIQHPTSQREETYNWAHMRTHNTVERCFAVWKRRFRCLQRGFRTKLEQTKLYIVALAILHNIAMHRQDLLEDVEEEDDGKITVMQIVSDDYRGIAERTEFINENF